MAEGRLIVQRVVEERPRQVQSVLVNRAAFAALEEVLQSLPSETPIFVGAAGLFSELTGFKVHRGCLALVRRPPDLDASGLWKHARTIVILEGLSDADNVGAVFRNGAAFGVDAMLLSPTCCDPLYRKAIRTSVAATLRLPFARLEPWPARLEDLRAAAFTIVALTPRQPSISLDEFVKKPRSQRIALIVGTEGAGISASVERYADARVRIPISSEVDSLNVAVATGIALARLSNQGHL